MALRIGEYVKLARPFTLLAPALGMVSAGVAGLGALPAGDRPTLIAVRLIAGAALAVALNAASNALNQICDLEIDRINKPGRPLPSGALSVRAAWVFTAVFFAVTLGIAAVLGRDVLIVVAGGSAAVAAYSIPPLRTKRFPFLSNLTIAAARGLLLPVAGWAVINTIDKPEAWFLGAIGFFFILGAASTKDFKDVEGDRAGGVTTLPIKYGAKAAAWMVAPSLVLPFLLMPLGAHLGVLTGRPTVLAVGGIVLALWGVYVAFLILRRPDDLGRIENHPSWLHMYLIMLGQQAVVMASYWPA